MCACAASYDVNLDQQETLTNSGTEEGLTNPKRPKSNTLNFNLCLSPKIRSIALIAPTLRLLCPDERVGVR